MSKHYKIYNALMALLAIISIILVILDYSSILSLNERPWNWLDNSILIIFAVDYFYRLYKADSKLSFFKHNIFDLLSIIPVNSFFSFFRIARLTRFLRLIKFLRLVRLVGLTGKIQKILHTNGLIYLLYISIILLVTGAISFSLAEHVSFGESFWWAIATATTVGYGDISPHTLIGKIIALVLMLIGIGVIGLLTSSLTTFFIQDSDEKEDNKEQSNNQQDLKLILEKLNKLEKQNIKLQSELDQIKNKASSG